jgi:hypothetical protein
VRELKETGWEETDRNVVVLRQRVSVETVGAVEAVSGEGVVEAKARTELRLESAREVV